MKQAEEARWWLMEPARGFPPLPVSFFAQLSWFFEIPLAGPFDNED